LSGAVATLHVTPTSIVDRWVCSTFFLSIRTRAASISNLCTRGHGVSIRTIACFVDSTVAANTAADPGSRKALHLIISTRAAISIIFRAYLRVIANILSAPIAAYIRAISNAAIY